MVKSSTAPPPAKKRGRGRPRGPSRPPAIKVNDDPKRGRGRPPVVKVNDEQYESSRKELLDRKKEIQSRLNKCINVASIIDTSDITTSTVTSAIPTTSSATILLAKLPTPTKVPQLPSTLKTIDTHWDYTLKEMAWLSTDFTSERKRQISQAKKLSNAIQTYFATLSTKKAREIQLNQLKVRKLGNKLNKLVLNSYWKKMEKVVEYKQRLNGEAGRRKEMDKRLVFLVKQTERYGERLTKSNSTTNNNNGDGSSEEGSKKSSLTIEESLSTSLGRRSSTKKSIDYMKLDAEFNDSDEDSILYGETTHVSNHNTRHNSSSSDSGGKRRGPIASKKDDNVDYIPTQSELNQEIKDENIEYTNLLNSFQEESKEDVKDEVLKLLQEKNMDIDTLLKRLMEEGGHEQDDEDDMEIDVEGDDKGEGKPLIEVVDEKPSSDVEEEDNKVDGGGRAAKKQRVSFAPVESTTLAGTSTAQPKSNNSLAMLNEDDHEEKDEFHLEREELDDETTIAAEERLGRDMSYEAEIDLLNRENEMSVEELRAMYANMDNDSPEEDEDEDDSVPPSVAASEDASKVASSLLDEDDHEEKDEFHLEKEELDDETTIAAEERLGRDMSYEAEINLLNQENEMSVEELRAMYANMDESPEEDGDEDEDDSVPPAAAASEDTKEAASSLLDEDDHEEKDEFHLEREEVDDETTIAAEERLGRDMSYEAEIDLLNRENEMSVEELRAMYANMDENSDDDEDEEDSVAPSAAASEDRAKVAGSSLLDEDDHEEKDEFHLEKEELDDETTIAAEERLGRDMSYEAEINLLNRENELSVEELQAMYANMDEEGDDEESDTVDSVEDRMDTSSGDASSKRKHSSSIAASDDSDDTSSKKTKTDEDEGISALQSLVASDTKARETMLTRPFLLASWVKLRAYQHVGLNWLVSIQSRRLNGILADEMGLGKTLQTISMLAYLASYKGIWGPHLIIVPTSCLVNWEVEFKRFCPGLKVLCYYGNAKRRKELRVGWTKPNVHHIVITSYQIAVQDSHAFKRKKWYYLILDEAHNIKNFESQRWQTLISFNTQRRLLLTGTPLQNNLMELWSLLHFLMPHVFTDRKQFSYWFSNPMDSIIEGNAKRNDDLINRLHGIIRPFVLRRLKKDVETQLPGKFEHIVKCQLSRRQMFLYEEFMARSSTRKAMSGGGNFMGMMSVLMQLRKVCNHPDLFEPRSVTSPFVMEPISMSTAACVVNAVEPKSALEQVSPFLRLPLLLVLHFALPWHHLHLLMLPSLLQVDLCSLGCLTYLILVQPHQPHQPGCQECFATCPL